MAECSGAGVGTMHVDQADIDADLVRQLVRSRFPQWSDLPITRVASTGTVNAIYRLGDELSVRLPLTAGGVADLEREVRWLPRLAATLPVEIPTVVTTAGPTESYPWPWAVLRWIEGEHAVEDHLDNPAAVAHDLAEFVRAMQRVTVDGGPIAHRGGPPSSVEREFRTAIETLRATDEQIDIDAAGSVWEEARAAPPWPCAPCWVHADLMPSNLLLTSNGHLTAVLDFGTVGVGDPACDLIPAWNLLPPSARHVFRHALDVDDATWLRARGWALAMAVIQLPYYRNTNPSITANARYTLNRILAG